MYSKEPTTDPDLQLCACSCVRKGSLGVGHALTSFALAEVYRCTHDLIIVKTYASNTEGTART